MAASNEHLNNILGGHGSTDDTPSSPDDMQRALANPDQQQEPEPHNPGLGPQAPEPQAQPEPQPQPQQAQTPEPDESSVPPHRLREEADRRRQAEERERRIADRFEMLQTQITERQDQERKRLDDQQIPSIDDDLPGYVQRQSQRFEEALNQERDARLALEKANEQNQIVNDIKARASSDAHSFGQTAPDFQQAYQWLRGEQLKELQAIGATPEQAVAHLDQQELQFSAHRIQQGMNAAEGFYAQARARGWGAQPQQQAAPQAQPQQSNVVPMPPTQQPAPVHAQPLDNIAHGQQQNMTLDMVPQGGSAVPMDLEKFADMSDADFMQYSSQVANLMSRQMR